MNLSRSLWKKRHAFQKLIIKLEFADSLILKFISELVAERSTESVCRLSSSSAAFLLLCLDCANLDYSESLHSCLLKLIPCINFGLARQLNLANLRTKVTDSLQFKYDYVNLQLLHFFPGISVDWNAFSKFLNEIKGFPEQFQDLLPFLGNFFNVHVGSSDLSGIVERLARRNSALSAGIFHQIVQCDTFSDSLNSYAATFEILVPSDNETVREYLAKVSEIVTLSDSICTSLLKSFPSASPKSKENISKFMAKSLKRNKPTPTETLEKLNFLELATKEISGSEVVLSALIQCASITANTEAMTVFLKNNLKANQKLSVKSSILLGITATKSFPYLNDEILKEIFSPSYLKEATAAGTPQSQTFFVCSLATMVNHPGFTVDAKLFNDSLIALTKPAGPAILTEKSWSSMDSNLAEMFLSQVVLPVAFNDANAILLPYCVSALAWFTVNGNKESMKLIKTLAKPISTEKADIFAASLDKFLEGFNETKAHRVWASLQSICSLETLRSRSLAIVCHDKSKLLGLGAGSWAELVRSKCLENICQFCKEVYVDFIKFGDLEKPKTSAFYLLETLISLCPSLVTEVIHPYESVSKSIQELLKFSPAQWSSLYAPKKPVEPVKAKTSSVTAPSNKPASKPQSPTTDDVTISAALLSAIDTFKHSLIVARAVSLALPFNHIFTDNRALLIVELLQCLANFDYQDLVAFIIESVYEIANESLNGKGPLLVSLFLRVSGFESLVDASWNIYDELLLIDSAFKVISAELKISELSFAALVLSKSLPRCKQLYDSNEFKHLLATLLKFSEQADSVDSRVILDLVHVLLQISSSCPPSIQASLVLLLVEIGEIPRLEIVHESDLSAFNLCLRSSSPATQLMLLKFLTAFAASHSNAHSLFECPDLLKTIWLLHFSVEKSSKIAAESADLDAEELEESEASKSYESEEVTIIATELCNLIQLSSLDIDFLSEIVLLETEKGEKEFYIKNLIEHYISALGASIKTSQDLDRIASEFKRLLTSRTTPNGIVRLTKNVDRSKLDFTRQTRKALLLSISIAAKRTIDNLLDKIVSFCFEVGFTDCNEENCEIVFSTVLSIIEGCKDLASEALYSQLQSSLTSVPADNDRVKVYAVISLGRASSRAPSLTSSPSRVWELIDRIKESLNIPSEKVQKAVADTLVPLFRSQREDKRISGLAFGFASRIREAKEDYGALRGAAFGLAALIESCGTGLIRSHEMFTILIEGLGQLNQKNSEAAVCSVLAAIEIISIRCGIVFEPYIAPLVPGVLEALGDSRQRVREDAEACADAMMSALSPLSVALILPPLLDMAGMDGCDPKYSWRAKLGAVTWLGSMACLAPKVLTPALPKIIPALIVALTDAHEKVHLAAHHALAVKYAAIIRSPEIKAALPAILRALSDPPRFASSCLGDIIGTSFCHAVDGPSLALLEPLLSRALRERGTGAMSEAKRRAILIIANLGSLMDPAELRPYLVNLVPALRGVLGDAVPQVRSGSARALGVLMRLMHNNGLAQECPVLLQIVPECLETIFSTLSSITSIDRAGAAQAIAQVTASRGLEPLIELVNEKVAPVLFNDRSKSSGTSREALLHLCAALPSALPASQVSKLYEGVFTRERLFSILQGTASEDEGVREISTKTIRSLLLRQALLVDLQTSLEILLKGSADGRWRLRLTSFTILSDLLPVLSMSPDESGNCDTKNRIVSSEMRARLLSRLFFGRFDSNGLIRNTAFSLWKSIVTHPPRVILEILPVLVDDCVASLEMPEEEFDSESEYESEAEAEVESESEPVEGEALSSTVKVDRYEMASTALQDILVKLSDRVLMPFLRRLTQIFTLSSSAGVLLAARIITSVVLVPNLIPPHQRTSTTTPVVSVPRAQIDEALKLVLNLTQQGLKSESERTVGVSVALFAKISQGLSTSPALFERIISDMFFESKKSSSSDALISVLNRRPKILLSSLVGRFKKLSVDADEIDWNWWTEVFAASGPFLAPHAPSLITHSLKLTSVTENEGLFDALLASMASYDPDVLYGDENAEAEDEEDLEDSVETGLFSFGQVLETLWSARNEPELAATLIHRFTVQDGLYGNERFYDIWLDRLLVSCLSSSSSDSESSMFAAALQGIIEIAVEREESLEIIAQLNQSVEIRSIVSKNISSKLPSELVLVLIKSLSLPVITNTSISTSDRFSACLLLQNVLQEGNLKKLASSAVTALLGALIRCLSDRSDTAKTERLKAALLPILLMCLKELPSVGKPFHPQLTRLALNVLKDLIASVSLSGNPIDFDQSHARGQIALVTCQLVSLLLLQMSRIDSLLEELEQFRVSDSSEEAIYDDLSTRNARRVLLFILKSAGTTASGIFPQNLAKFSEETVKFFMSLPSSEIDLIRETAQIGLLLSTKIGPAGKELEQFINNLI